MVKLYRLATDAGFVVRNSQGRALCYVYGQARRTTAEFQKLSIDEAEAVAKVVARALSKDDPTSIP